MVQAFVQTMIRKFTKSLSLLLERNQSRIDDPLESDSEIYQEVKDSSKRSRILTIDADVGHTGASRSYSCEQVDVAYGLYAAVGKKVRSGD